MPTEPPAAQAVDVTLGSPARQPPLVGYNLNAQTRPTTANTAYSDSLGKLEPQLIRYPGGTVGDYWDWTTGRAHPDSWWTSLGRLQNFAYLGNSQLPSFSLSELNEVRTRARTGVLFQLNLVSGRYLNPAMLRHQMDMLSGAQALGMGVDYIELGNEAYFDEADFRAAFANPAQYANRCQGWVDSLRAAFPQAKLAVIGAISDPLTPAGTAAPERVRTWNAALYAARPTADAVAFHYYFPPGTTVANPSFADAIGSATARLNRYLDYSVRTLPPGYSAWITEFNTNDGAGGGATVMAGTWAQGLLLTHLMFQMAQDERITLLMPHQVSGPSQWAALDTRAWGNDATNRLTAYGNACRLVFRAWRQSQQMTPLRFSTNPLTGSGSSSYPALQGWACTGRDGKLRYLLLNLSGAAYQLSHAAWQQGMWSGESWSESQERLFQPQRVSDNLNRPNVRVQNGRLTVASYSLTLLESQ